MRLERRLDRLFRKRRRYRKPAIGILRLDHDSLELVPSKLLRRWGCDLVEKAILDGALRERWILVDPDLPLPPTGPEGRLIDLMAQEIVKAALQKALQEVLGRPSRRGSMRDEGDDEGASEGGPV